MALRAKYDNKIFSVGDTIRVQYKIVEGDKERIQGFEGIVIMIKGEKENKSFTVRRFTPSGIGVERGFPLISPWIKDITVKKQGKVRRAKLYYLRKRIGKSATRIKKAA